MVSMVDVMNQAARRCKVRAPSDIVTSTAETAMELKDFLAETAEEVLDRLDLPSPITLDVNITGTGVAAYALPNDFLRLTRDGGAVLEATMSRRVCVPVATNAAWTGLSLLGSGGASRYYRLLGNADDGYTIEFYRPLEAGSIITVSYVQKYWLRNDAEVKSAWTDNADRLLLPEDVVRLGIIWRFKQSKGLAYADVVAEYEMRLSRKINDARGLKVIDIGGRAESAHPMRVPVPDVISFGQ
jgi:hypothetical protein